jgi:small subunit ribosomal protein S17
VAELSEEQLSAETPSSSKKPRSLSGLVVGDSMDKTIKVLVERSVKHPVYGKIIRRKSKVYAHDEKNECAVGDQVTVIETRPISKLKAWRLQSVDVKTTEVTT